MRILESMGKPWTEPTTESRILAAPRLLVLDKQDAEVQLGSQLGYQEKQVSRATGTVSQVYKEVPIGTQFRVRPSLATNGMIRLDASVGRSTGYLDGNGVPNVNSFEISIDATMPNGGTIAVGSKVYADVQERSAAVAYLSWLPYCGWLSFVTEDVTTNRQVVALISSHSYKR